MSDNELSQRLDRIQQGDIIEIKPETDMGTTPPVRVKEVISTNSGSNLVQLDDDQFLYVEETVKNGDSNLFLITPEKKMPVHRISRLPDGIPEVQTCLRNSL